MNMRKMGRAFAESAKTLQQAGDTEAQDRLRENGGDLAERMGGKEGRDTFEIVFDRSMEGDTCVECGESLPADRRHGDRCHDCAVSLFQAHG